MLTERLRLRDIRNVSTFRLTLLFGLLFLLGVTALLGIIYLLVGHDLTERSDRILRLEAARLATTAPADLPQAVRAAMANNTSRLTFFALQARDGHMVVGDIAMPADLRFDQPQDVAPAPGEPKSLRLLVVRMPHGETLYVARDIMTLIDLRHHLLVTLVTSGALTLLFILAGGIMVSLPPLRRVRALQTTGREIAAGNLDTRMPILGRGDELDLLAGTVNVMVDEVARMIAQVRDVTDVIAHDLRSPLARVHTHLSRMRQASDPGTEQEERLATALIDIQLVLDRFSALLRIAELEGSRRRSGFGIVELQPLFDEVIDLYLPVAEDRRISLSAATDGDLAVFGDEQLLFEALSNLVDNAIKFGPEDSEVRIVAEMTAAGTAIEVRDQGPGIPLSERALVLRRFHRGRNAQSIAGSGIGLSAVMAIVHMHGFLLELVDGTPGLTARILAPRPTT